MISKYFLLQDDFLFEVWLVFPVISQGESYQNVLLQQRVKNVESLTNTARAKLQCNFIYNIAEML